METSRIRNIDLAQIEPNKGQIEGLPFNPRKWTKDELEDLKTSIQETPELLEARGLIVYPYQGKYVILGGNMRYAALKSLGYMTAPCYVMPEEASADKLKEIVIKDNGSFGEWDMEALHEDWADLDLDSWGVIGWEDVAAMPGEEKEVVDDDFDEDNEQIPTRCHIGDIWQLGEHRLMCGDATKPEDLSALMEGEKADLWLTDPPYNVNYEGGTKDALKIMNDNMDDASFREFLRKSFSAADENMSAGAAFYIWHADGEGFNCRGACRDIGWKVRECLIWVKNSMVLGRQDYQWRHEPCLYGWKEGASHRWYSDRKQTTVLEFNKPTRSEEHPTMKPLELFAYQMKNSSKEGDIVLDSFGGSGTTMIVAEQLGRKSRLLELDPHYCDVILARWEKFTGSQASLISPLEAAAKRGNESQKTAQKEAQVSLET